MACLRERPGPSLLDLGIASSLATGGTLMAPLAAATAAAVFAGAIAFSVALDAVKHVTFRRFSIVHAQTLLAALAARKRFFLPWARGSGLRRVSR
jgi:hypothetical protein